MRPTCCPRCRLLQQGGACAWCGSETVALPALLRERIEGLTVVPKKPATGWRDSLALLATAFGMLGAGTAGLLITHSPAGFWAAPVVGLLGYRKQFWRTAFKRRPRLAAMPAPAPPEGDIISGIAAPFEHTLAGGALAIATTITSSDGVIVRAIEAVPFWVGLGDRRVLVAGDAWLAGAPVIDRRAGEALQALGASDLPLDRRLKKQLRVARVRLIPGDRASVRGRVREEQLPGGGGYRDALAEVVRGEPGACVWIETAASDGVAPARREARDAGA